MFLSQANPKPPTGSLIIQSVIENTGILMFKVLLYC
nr:MAG TPA: hypothetical protein [Caudoviricetes sp.]